MTSRSKYQFVAGASVIGASHIQLQLPNQDAFKARLYGYGCVLAVADGVGSNRYSQFGSKAAVQAVHEAFCAFARGDIARSKITETITKQYCSILKTCYHTSAATTCLFAAHIYGQGLYLGQIGDGLACGKISGQPVVFRGPTETFSNLVQPLSPKVHHPNWKTKFIHEKRLKSIQLMLSTDGVSEDILPGREAEFVDYLIEQVESMKPVERDGYLCGVLSDWKTPNSYDDKTLVLYQYLNTASEEKMYGSNSL